MKYQHVLLAADLLKQDDDPVSDRALEIAQASGAKLSIIHVVEFPYAYGLPYEGTVYAQWQLELENSAKANFKALADRLKIPNNQRHLPTGEAKRIILETADKIKADLIVVGSHGRHGLGLLLLGSTANGVLHGAKCDVLAVRVQSL